MRTYIWREALLAAAVLGLTQTACITRGEDFSSDIAWVKKNVTTRAEVEKYLGEPFSVGNSGGVKTSTYGYYKHQLFNESKTKELKFYWTPDFKVQDFSFNSSFPEDRRRMLVK